MRAAFALIFALLLFLPGCMEKEFSDRRVACFSNRSSTDCTPAALDYAILKKDRGNALAMCNAIDAPTGDAFLGSAKDRCYMQVAEALQDETVCDNMGVLLSESVSVTKKLCQQNARRPVRTPLCGIAFVLPILAALALFVYKN